MENNNIPNDVEPTHPLFIVTLSNIIKLTTTNYLSWKLQLEATLIGYGLFQFLDGSHPPPLPTVPNTTNALTNPATHSTAVTNVSPIATNPAYTTWVRQDKLLFGALIGTLDSTIVPLVSRASTAKEAWDILAHTFARQSRGHTKLFKANFRLITEGTQKVLEFMNVIRVCVAQLAILGDPVKPEDLIERVLEGLQDSNYQPIIDAVNARDTLITFDELHEKLLIREVSLRTQSNIVSTPLPATVHATATRYQQSTTPRQSETIYRSSNNQKSPGNYQKKNNTSKGQGYQGK